MSMARSRPGEKTASSSASRGIPQRGQVVTKMTKTKSIKYDDTSELRPIPFQKGQHQQKDVSQLQDLFSMTFHRMDAKYEQWSYKQGATLYGTSIIDLAIGNKMYKQSS